MNYLRALIAGLFCLVAVPVNAQQFHVGDHVHSTISGFDGTISEMGGPDGFVKVYMDGHPPEHANWMNPKWLKPAGSAAPSTSLPTSTGSTSVGNNPMQSGNNNAINQSGSKAGTLAVGSRVEFDRVQGSQPKFGRWDSGTILGRDQFGRVQIKSDNGITYSIQDDPRWILTGGSKTPGPRHDYNDHPVATQPAVSNSASSASNGAAAPFSGEWTVVSLDGRRYEAGAQNFNFVGSRYEILNQGMTMSGNFSVNGNSVRMISDDGSPFATFQYSIQGGQMVLTAPGTQYVLVPAHK